ncbi:hypothetical protein Dimus_035525 [Dionaea muscipula]
MTATVDGDNVCVALVTPQSKRSSKSHNDHGEGSSGQKQKYSSVNAKCRVRAAGIPSLVLGEIVELVRSNPGDTRILQHHEPLNVLVKGVLSQIERFLIRLLMGENPPLLLS